MENLVRSFTAACMIVVLLSLAFPAGQVQAAAYSFAVNDAGDASDASRGNGKCATSAGRCTLRAAIEEVNALKVYGQATNSTITIPPMIIGINNELALTSYRLDSVNIKGSGPGQTIIDGKGATRAFSFFVEMVRTTETRSGGVTVSDLSVRNANSAVYTKGYKPGYGGAFFIDEHVTMNNVGILGNTAKRGGGIYIDNMGTGDPSRFKYHPVVRLNNVTVFGNTATTRELGFGGGGIYNGGAISAFGLTIRSNLSYSQGGGLYMNSWYLSDLHNVDIDGNISHSSGGGINLDLGSLQIFDGAIRNNGTLDYRPNGSIPGGAGAYVNGYPEPGYATSSLLMQRVAVLNNNATANGSMGGGIVSTGILSLENVSILNNRASYGAGIYTGVYSTSELLARNTVISANIGVASSGISSEGAGLTATAGKAIFVHSQIINNHAAVAGGISSRLGATALVELYNSMLIGNYGDQQWKANDCMGVVVSGGNNILGVTPGQHPNLSCNLVTKSNDRINVDPKLGQIVGFPMYYPLLPGSPAINTAGSSACYPFDIRLVRRPQGSGCDIGPYEAGS